jgi:hypothetical protein
LAQWHTKHWPKEKIRLFRPYSPLSVAEESWELEQVKSKLPRSLDDNPLIIPIHLGYASNTQPRLSVKIRAISRHFTSTIFFHALHIIES